MLDAISADATLDISGSWFTRADLERGFDFVDRADVLVICRTRYDRRVGQMIARARARGTPAIFDVDDLIFDLRHAHLIADTIGQEAYASAKWNDFCAYVGQLGLTLQHCDRATTTNTPLAKEITEFAPEIPVGVIPNFFNAWQAEVSSAIFRRKFANGGRRDGKLHIGYFSGTNTHARDFAVAAGSLDRLICSNPHVILNIVGPLELPSALARHENRVRSLPLQDFINLQRLQGEVEIAIAPLHLNRFTNCKSDLKYFEAALVGTVVVASPSHAFRAAIRDGVDGFLAEGHDWATKLGEALALLDEGGAAYREFVERTRTRVEHCYASRRYGKAIEEVLFY